MSSLSVGFAVLGLGGVASANAFLISAHDAKAVGRGKHRRFNDHLGSTGSPSASA